MYIPQIINQDKLSILLYIQFFNTKDNNKKSMKGLKKYLNKYGFVSPNLSAIPLASFEYLFEILYNEIESKDSLLFLSSLQREQKIGKIFDVLSETYESVTLFSIIKRLTVIFMLTRKYIEKERLDEKLIFFLKQSINNIVHSDSKVIIEKKEKKSSSLGKIYQYIRELSGSKEKDREGRTKIEDNSEKGVKGALRETLDKTILPFCSYLLRVIQDYQTYSLILSKNQTKSINEARWKLINWSRCLGEIVSKLPILSRYFTKDFEGVLVFIIFLCSKDLALYYDHIKGSIEEESIQFAATIAKHKKRHTSLNTDQVEGLMNLKRSIEQMINIKQKINGIFGNVMLANWVPFFEKPTKYKVFDQLFVNEVQFIMAYKEHQTHQKHLQNMANSPRTSCGERSKSQEDEAESWLFRLSEKLQNCRTDVMIDYDEGKCELNNFPRTNYLLNRKDHSPKITALRKEKRIQLVQ